MDEKQRNNLEKFKLNLADVLNFNETVAKIRDKKLVSKESIDNIVDSNEPDAYEEFIKILKLLKNEEALKILEPQFKFKQSEIVQQLADIYIGTQNNQKNLPLGMNSGDYESPKANNTSGYVFSPPTSLNKHSHNLHHSSPLKAPPQVTLVKKSGGLFRTSKNTPTTAFPSQLDQQFGQEACMSRQSEFTQVRNQLSDSMKAERDQPDLTGDARGSPLSPLTEVHQRGAPQKQAEQPAQPQSLSTPSSHLRTGGGQKQKSSGGITRAFTTALTEKIEEKILLLTDGRVDDDESHYYDQIRNNVILSSTSDKGVQQDSVSDTQPNEPPIMSFHPYETLDNEQTSTTSSLVGSTCRSHFSSHYAESDASSVESVMSYIDPNHHVTSEISHYPDILKTMEVRMATELRYNREDDYKMTAKPRGPCLIVNNVEFEGDIFPARKGSDNDATRFDTIFHQLGFQVTHKRNLTADQMREAVKDLARSCRIEHDSVFVFILSHGSEHGIYGTDGMEVDLDREVLTYFDNRHCKVMIGKPKVFVIQACRGMSRDCGGVAGNQIGDGDSTDAQLTVWPSVAASPNVTNGESSTVQALQPSQINQVNRVPDSWLPPSRSSQDDKKRKHPIRTDMLIVYSCLAGYVSIRNETAGSWLGVALAYFIMTHSCERDLIRILNLVTSDVIQRESSQGHIQSIELKLLGWTKNLYLNPGQYE